MYFSKSKYINIYQVIVMPRLSNNANTANIYEKDLLEIEEIFSLYSKCLNSEGWDKYLAKTLKLNTNKFSEFLEKETSDRGVNLEYRTLFNFLQDNVLKKFEASVPSQFSKKEVFKLLLSAIFQSSIDGINDNDYVYKDIKKELESYITELEKSMEEVANEGEGEGEDEDEKKTKHNDGVINQSYEPPNHLNDRLKISRKECKEIQRKNSPTDERKGNFIELLSLFIDVENEIINPGRRWRTGQVTITPNDDETFLNHMGVTILDWPGNIPKSNSIINEMETTINNTPQKQKTRSSQNNSGNTTQVNVLYAEKKNDFERIEKEVFEVALNYIKNLLIRLNNALEPNTTEDEKEFIENMELQLDKLTFEPLQFFGGDIDATNPVNPVYTTSYKTTLLRKVVEVLYRAFQKSGFLISEKIVKLIRNMRGSDEVLDIKQDPLILRLLYKTYSYVTSSLMKHKNDLEQNDPEHQSLSEAICEKYKINDDFRDIIKDEGDNNEREKIKMAIAFAFNNNIYF